MSLFVGWAGAQGALWLFDLLASQDDTFSRELYDALKLDEQFVSKSQYWTAATYALVHSSFPHFLLNILVFFLAGREVEPIIGKRHFMAMSLVAWIAGGFISAAALLARPGADANGFGVVGFSAVAAAALAAYSSIMPELEQRVNVFYFLEIRFRAKFYALAVVALASACLFFDTFTEVGPAGILIGSIIGWAWTKQLGFGNPLWIQRLIFERRQRVSRRERMSAEDFVALEVDPILDKILRSGFGSLTRAERAVLEQGRGKLDTKETEKTVD
jgi:membrane associated rhomboid family serine protease